MDVNNVLSLTYNLEELDKDLYDWSMLPEKMRILSDSNCRNVYGCTNRELYNKLKGNILFNKPFEKEVLVQSNNTVTTESYDYGEIDRKDLIMRIGMAKSMNNNDVLVAIIYPYDPELISDSNYRETYKKEFMEIYNKFIKLTDKYQKYSNLYSIQLFGYNVRAMYQLILPDLVDDHDIDDNQDTYDMYSRDYVDSQFSAVEESLTEYLLDKNIIELYKFKLCSCNSSISEASTDDIYRNSVINEVNQCIHTDNFENALNSVVPYFTISEFDKIIDKEEIDVDSVDLDNISSRDYYKSITELYKSFVESGDISAKNKMLSLGWNPYVDPYKFMNSVRDRQVRYLKEHACNVIDITGISESSTPMNNLYEKMNLYPVYIILSYTNTLFGNIIRKIKKSTFTHSGFALDSDLNEIYTFKFDTKLLYNGFCTESLDKYIEIFKDARIDVLCLFVDGETLDRIHDNLNYFTTNKSKTKYNFKNLINVLRNKAKDNDPENTSLICSQFVDTLLKLAGIDLTGKSSNIVIPQDFEDIKNPKVYKVYEGLARKYNEAKVEGKIHTLITGTNVEDIRYSDFVDKLYESTDNLISHRYNIIDNNKADSILKEFYEYIDIEPLIYSKVVLNPDDNLVS